MPNLSYVTSVVDDGTLQRVNAAVLLSGPPDVYLNYDALTTTAQTDLATLVAKNGGTLPLKNEQLMDTVLASDGTAFRLKYGSLFQVNNNRYTGSGLNETQATQFQSLVTRYGDGAIQVTATRAGYTLDRNALYSSVDAIQALIEFSADEGVSVLIGDGNYKIDAEIYALSGATIELHPRATLLRAFSQVGASGLLQNDDMATPVSHFHWSGGRIRNPDPANLTGNSVCLNADDTLIAGLVLDEWSDQGRAMLLVGDRMRLANIRGVSLNDGGGIRYAGGTDFTCIGSYMYCGDDAFQMVPGGSSTSAIANRDILRAQYIGCNGGSWNGRLCVAGLKSDGELSMTASIMDSSFLGISGRAKRLLTVDNEDSTGKIANITVANVSCDCTMHPSATDNGNAAITINCGSSGSVDGINLDRLHPKNQKYAALEILGTGPVRNVRVRGGEYLRPTQDGYHTVYVRNAKRLDLNGAKIQCGTLDGIRLGQSGDTVDDVVISDVEVTDIRNGQHGLDIAYASNVRVKKNTWAELSGQTLARAINCGAGSRNVTIEPQDAAGISSLAGISFPKNANSGHRVEFSSAKIGDVSGRTVRASDSGGTFTNGAGSGTALFTLPSVTEGLRYTFRRTGTGAMDIACDGTETIVYGAATTTPTTGRLTLSTVFTSVQVEALSNSQWVVSGVVGSLTVS